MEARWCDRLRNINNIPFINALEGNNGDIPTNLTIKDIIDAYNAFLKCNNLSTKDLIDVYVNGCMWNNIADMEDEVSMEIYWTSHEIDPHHKIDIGKMTFIWCDNIPITRKSSFQERNIYNALFRDDKENSMLLRSTLKE